MAEISVRVESRAEAEWLWSRLLGARIEDEPLRVVIDSSPSLEARRVRVLATLEVDGRTFRLDTDGPI